MLDSETKRRIDSARDILVGKVPDPKSQVEQITIALIYKFMDDMDQESVEMGGKASFFKGEFKKYSWSNVFDPRLGGIEMLSLYGEAITRMNQNPNVPQLFRDIFKNAYLPYRDPETLKLFLKTINEFSYDHSEKLGDAFEYLLSVLGSQGDAGQFRTPRHIIDFMVQVVDPKKNETVLDPACGTAGFLISAYKYILKTPSGRGTSPKSDKRLSDLGEGKGGGLTTQEKQALYTNFTGYDISPDMVRLSLVNLYLHGFVKPQIHEYDTLASEDRWNEYADVILANPPFMSPKGGIMPHKKFSVQSNRSEVLFVDYMAEHLTPNGRAAIIVPEGMIFQSAGAYKQLRKYLIENNFLWAVVSLPAGVFNPYAGVKTSILFLDKSLAKKTDKVLFVKVENDGFDLGAQRRPIDRNDLPKTLNILRAWRDHVVARGDSPEAISASDAPTLDSVVKAFAKQEGVASPKARNDMVLVVSISKLAESDYNLSADRYREVIRNHHQQYPMVALGELCQILSGHPFDSKNFNQESGYPVIRIRDIKPNSTETKYLGGYPESHVVENGDLLVGMDGEFNRTIWQGGKALLNQRVCKLHSYSGVLKEYVYLLIEKPLKEIEATTYAVTVKHISNKQILGIQIPLPTLEVQRQIVEEIAAHQRIIDGALQVVEGWKPNLEIELEEFLPEGMDKWETTKLEDVLNFVGSGVTPLGGKETYVEEGVLFIRSQNVLWGTCDFSDAVFITKEVHKEMSRSHVKKNDVLLNITGASIGRSAIYLEDREANVNQHVTILRCNKNIEPNFLMNYLISKDGQDKIWSVQSGASRQALNYQQIKAMQIPLPPLEIQREIVARIETERAIVHGNRELIRLYEEKVKKVIERVWEG